MIGSEKFQWGYECWDEQTRQRVDSANVPEFVPVGNVLTIPRDREIKTDCLDAHVANALRKCHLLYRPAPI